MWIAFAITRLFPGGGLQRDCVEIAREICRRGHRVTVFTTAKEIDFASDLDITLLPAKRRTNHGRQAEFSAALQQMAARQDYDLLVGFDKLENLDVMYCADPSIRARMLRSPWLFLLPRYRTFHVLERASFAPKATTRLLMLSQNQSQAYRDAWRTEPERLILLPPTIAAARRHPEYRTDGTRQALRATLGVAPDHWVWLAIGTAPHTKGLDRSIGVLRSFPRARLAVAGLKSTDGRLAHVMAAKARRLGVADRVLWLGHREDIPQLMAAADLLVHPARNDTTGTVILEAMVNGLPVITTAVCGYAEHVRAAGAGIVVDAPFADKAYLAALATAQDRERCARWSVAGARYGEQTSLYEGRSRAAEFMLGVAAEAASVTAASDGGVAREVVAGTNAASSGPSTLPHSDPFHGAPRIG